MPFLPRNGHRWWLDAPTIWGPTWGLPWPIWGPSLPEIEPRVSRGGGTFGPIAGPVDIPPTFGPIAGRVPREPTSFDQRRMFMPFDLGSLLPGRRNTSIGGVIGGIVGDVTRRVLQRGPTQPRLPPFFPGAGELGPPSRSMTFKGCGPCVIERELPARIVRQKGRVRMAEDGSVECVAVRRRFNPANGQAALRAVARLKVTQKLMRRIDKALQRACRSKSRSRFTSRKKGSCK